MKRQRYVVLMSAFHGGGVVSYHRTEQGAEKACAKWRGDTECTCGCVGVWDRKQLGEPIERDGSEHYWELRA